MRALARQFLKPLKPFEEHTPLFVQEWSQRLLTDLDIDAEPFEGFSDSVRPAMMKVANTRFYRYAEHRAERTKIPGWLSAKERQILYALGRWLPGPITEIGSWCGLSTTAIARGIHDSGGGKEFKTYDLVLTEDQFRPVDGGIGLFLPSDDYIHGICSEESFLRDIYPIVSAPGGTNGLLKKHLERLGFLKKTEIFVGDFRTHASVASNVLFCDCLHDEAEIEANAPALRPWLRSGSIFACHDIGGVPSLISSLRKRLPIGHGVTIDSIYLAEISAS